MISGAKQSANNHFLAFIQQDTNELHVCALLGVTVTINSFGTSEVKPSACRESRFKTPPTASPRRVPSSQQSPSLMG